MIDLQQNNHTSHIFYRMACIDGEQCRSNHVSYCMDHQELINVLRFWQRLLATSMEPSEMLRRNGEFLIKCKEH